MYAFFSRFENFYCCEQRKLCDFRSEAVAAMVYNVKKKKLVCWCKLDQIYFGCFVSSPYVVAEEVMYNVEKLVIWIVSNNI